MVLAVPPALLAGCGSAYPPAQVLAALRTLGFADVVTVAPFERALREAALAAAQTPASRGDAGAASGGGDRGAETGRNRRDDSRDGAGPGADAGSELTGAGAADRALVSGGGQPHRTPLPVAGAPTRGVRIPLGGTAGHLRRPSGRLRRLLPQSALGAAQSRPERPRPVRRDRLLEPARAEYLAPEVIRQAVMMRLTGHGGDGSATDPGAAGNGGGAAAARRLRAGRDRSCGAGARHTGGFRRPAPGHGHEPRDRRPRADRERPARRRGRRSIRMPARAAASVPPCSSKTITWPAGAGTRAGRPVEADEAVRAASGATRPASATARRRPYAARPGIRLDADMSRAIEKLGRLQAVIRALPGGTVAPAAPPPARPSRKMLSCNGPASTCAPTPEARRRTRTDETA